MKNYLQIATLALPLLFGGCETERKEPKREDYNNRLFWGVTETPKGRMHLVDENSDGSVDIFVGCPDGIASGGKVWYIAEGHETRYNAGWPYSSTMTAQVRNLASKVLDAQKELRFQLDKEMYKKQKKGE